MSIPPAQTLTDRAMGALRNGNADGANSLFDEALQVDRMFVPALIGKGDVHVRRGEERAAASFYAAALKVAGTLSSMPDAWRSEIGRAQRAIQGIAGKFETHLRAALDSGGLGCAGGERVGRALDLMLGKRQIYLQQPKNFYFPELPQIEFYGRELFPWVSSLEACTAVIRGELEALLRTESGFEPYLQTEANRPSLVRNPLMDDPNWSAFFLIKNGSEVAANAARCPRTMNALREIPFCGIRDRSPSVLFSLLRPGCHIRPHHGFTNARLICHLPLIVPGRCGLRVGNETREWREGEMLVFDDSIEHEAWNHSDLRRVVLIFDVWRPELSPRECDLVARLLEAANRFDGGAAAWSD